MKLGPRDAVLVAPAVVAAIFVYLYALPNPTSDEWLLLRNAMILQRSDSLSGALGAMSFRIYDHPILVPALVYLPVAEVFNYDSRATIALTLLALFAVLVVFRLTITRSTASAFPVAVVLFSPAVYVPLLWGFQFTLGFSVAFAVMGLAVLHSARGLALRQWVRLSGGFALIGLGIGSSAGAAFALPAAAVMFLASDRLPRRERLLLAVISLALFVVAVAAFSGGAGRILDPIRTAFYVLDALGTAIVSAPIAIYEFGVNPRSLLGALIAVPALVAAGMAARNGQLASVALPLALFLFGIGAVAAIAMSREYLANWHLQYALPAICGAYGVAYALPKRRRAEMLPLAVIVGAFVMAVYGYGTAFTRHRADYQRYSGAVALYMKSYLAAPDMMKPYPPTGGWDFDAEMARFLIEKRNPLFRSD
ncbi:hypothetical protein [Bosea sp. 117]|uniref:hypothetical protein n=1 Tax=Bosea sp. 117 TaxID=1125973 RepID=UPI000493DB3A|nr:hypothetical protein [Bosea sp. 117]